MSDYQVAGTWQDDLTAKESLALPLVVAWTAKQDRDWRRDGEFYLWWRTKTLQAQKRSRHHTIDEAIGAAHALDRWCTRGDGRWDVKITYRDEDGPATGVSAFADDVREQLAIRRQQGDESEGRERSLRGSALSHARRQNGADGVTRREKALGFFATLSWLFGRGRDDTQDDRQESET